MKVVTTRGSIEPRARERKVIPDALPPLPRRAPYVAPLRWPSGIDCLPARAGDALGSNPPVPSV
jgi:hypothetical protein